MQRSWRAYSEAGVQIGCPVNGTIELSSYGKTFISSRGFQRLRFLKQLGSACYVLRFASGAHTRFQHSLGVGGAARSLGIHLWETQPDLDLREEDIVMLELAGECWGVSYLVQFLICYKGPAQNPRSEPYWCIDQVAAAARAVQLVQHAPRQADVALYLFYCPQDVHG
jgi:hypothetical protein